MTDTAQVLVPVTESRRSSAWFRFGVAFLIGLIAATALGAGALYAYDRQYEGKILPGVRIGSTDLSGMTPPEAAAALSAAYASLGAGSVILHGPEGDLTIDYGDIGRGPDIDTMVAEAMSIGHGGNPAERAIAGARTAVNGITLEPRVTFDAEALIARVGLMATSLAETPSEASVTIEEGPSFRLVPGASGREADAIPPTNDLLASLGRLDAPATVSAALPISEIEPRVTTQEALAAKALAERVTAPITFTVGKDEYKITGSRLRTWVSFAATVGGGYRPILDTTELRKVLKTIAKKVDRKAVNATYRTSGTRISGVVPSRDGRKLDQEATVLQVQRLLADRMGGATTAELDPKVKITAPALTTAEAKAARPKMRKVSSWTTFFPIGEKNGFGANIWLPALAIDGYVVAPGAKFDFWEAVGTISRAKGYRQGGAIIDGRTEPQGALAGGICSCSTTLFNAALRAGYKMGARRNHFYYIDRYPLGLDATVFISGSGSKQTMSFTNDTKYPILIRGYKIRNGGSGYVRFTLYSVPNGRRVSFSRPIVKNVRQASDTVQYTNSLRPGAAQRIEYPVDGKQVWVTRTVRNKAGKIIHRDTYYSNYARITGITLIGRASADR